MNARSLVVSALTALTLTACGAAPDAETEKASTTNVAQGLTLKVQTDTELSGTFTDGVITLTFSSIAIGEKVHQARVSSGPRTIEYTVNSATAELEYTSGHVALDAEEVEAVKALDIALGSLRNTKEPSEYTRPEQILFSMMDLATESRPGEVVPVIKKIFTRSVTNIGCSNTCRTIYGSSACGKGGLTYYKQTGINSPNCKGRCGGGCGDARSNGATRWTMDCAEHDYHVGPLGDCADDAAFTNTSVRCGTTSSEYCATNCSCQPTGADCF